MNDFGLKSSDGFFGRRNRVRVLPWICACLFYMEVRNLMHRDWDFSPLLGYLGLIGVLFFLWTIDCDDLKHLAKEEQAAAEDPKYLMNTDLGIRYHDRSRVGIALSLIVMGLGGLIRMFETGKFGFAFWGTTLILGGCFLLLGF
jgi:hypothetical protein